MTTEPNKERAERAFRNVLSPDYFEGNVDPAIAVRDLLSELLHYCHEQGIDFDNELRIARVNYRSEI